MNGRCFVCVEDFMSLGDLQNHRYTEQHKINMERNANAIEEGLPFFELFSAEEV